VSSETALTNPEVEGAYLDEAAVDTDYVYTF